MQRRYNSISIEDIPIDFYFEGYLWLSNARKPQILRNEKIDIALFKQLPFIVEGNLWSVEQNVNIQIRNIDGEYQIASIDLSNCDTDHLLAEKTYIAHDLKGVTEYRIIEAWEEKEDELSLQGMKTLLPTWTAFKGFVNTKNQEQ